jgi:four helix bundle protein
MTPAELKARTFQFSLDSYRLAKAWFREYETRHVAQQLVRASSSVASNYRAACFGRSHAEFTAKIGIAREESDESAFWTEFAQAAHFPADPVLVRGVHLEACELTRIFDASFRTSRGR